ncbi:hypothetical protein ACJ2A9_16375 [Anaerobacillus sp. MEB173]|uniref:hypothetical protein n=1 Tax=Anaerobacillus sp. MEB173 TaxID=3383345 RepID=UPI003F90114C
MLEVIVTYTGELPVFEKLRECNFLYKDGNYILEKEIDHSLLTLAAHHDAEQKKITLTFSGELKMEQYQFIHDTINKLNSSLNGVINDSKASMGYLKDGSEAYIINGWNPWISFLQEAKHSSMEGQKVQVYDGPALLAEGILMSFEKDENESEHFKIKKCSLITTFGDREYSGEDLIIRPTGEFM